MCIYVYVYINVNVTITIYVNGTHIYISGYQNRSTCILYYLRERSS